MRKTTAALSLATALSLTPVAAAPAAAHVTTDRPAAVTQTPAPNQNNNNDNKGMNGLWGLLGLAGLLGLIPRRRKTQQPDQMAHVSDANRTTSREYQGASRSPRT